MEMVLLVMAAAYWIYGIMFFLTEDDVKPYGGKLQKAAMTLNAILWPVSLFLLCLTLPIEYPAHKKRQANKQG